MGKTVMVTGASGFVGRHLGHLLRTEQINTMAYSLRYGQDVRDYDQLRSYIAMAQPDEIHHLAAQAFVPETATNPQRGYEVNVRGTINLLEAVRQTGSRARIHIAGTSEEYGYEHPSDVLVLDETVTPRPSSPYGASKLAAGMFGMVYAARYGMDVVVTRAFNHTGPGQSAQYALPSFARQVAAVAIGQQDKVKVGNLEAVRNYTDVRDVVRAYRAAIALPPGIYNICSDVTTTMGDYLVRMATQVSEQIEVESDPDLYRPMYTTGNQTMPPPSCGLLREATGWEPQFTVEQMLHDLVDHWMLEQS